MEHQRECTQLNLLFNQFDADPTSPVSAVLAYSKNEDIGTLQFRLIDIVNRIMSEREPAMQVMISFRERENEITFKTSIIPYTSHAPNAGAD
jgi:hypothetical protein